MPPLIALVLAPLGALVGVVLISMDSTIKYFPLPLAALIWGFIAAGSFAAWDALGLIAWRRSIHDQPPHTGDEL